MEYPMEAYGISYGILWNILWSIPWNALWNPVEYPMKSYGISYGISYGYPMNILRIHDGHMVTTFLSIVGKAAERRS